MSPDRLGSRSARAAVVVAAAFVAATPMTAGAQQADSAGVPALLCGKLPAGARTGLATPLDELARILEATHLATSGDRIIRRASEARWPEGCADGPGRPEWRLFRGLWVEALPVDVAILSRSGYPDDRNNGLAWAGRGVTVRAGAGAAIRWGPVTAALAPEAAWQQNRAFDVVPVDRPGYSRYVYPWKGGIDYPQRFGDDAFTAAGWGQSYLRADGYGVAVGFAVENLWWGPAQRYPILMSNTAPGFPHVFLGTSRPVDIWIGEVEAEIVVGETEESRYFDQVPDNDRNRLLAAVAAFSPRPLPGLRLGGVRVYHYEGTDMDLGETLDQIAGLAVNQGVNLPGNELVSLFFRWVFPEAGAEVYGEWARDDRFYDMDEFWQEPDHSQAYMLGLQKTTAVGSALAVRVHGELVALQEKSELRLGSRPLPVYYTHGRVRQGYTHRGQLLGAGVGPGSDAQFVGVDLLGPWGTGGLFAERVRRNDAAGAAVALRRHWPYEHDAELTAGLRGLVWPLEGWTVSGHLSFSRRYNRDFGEDDANTSIGLEVSWHPRGRERER